MYSIDHVKVDESGDFGEFSKHSPYYIITISYNIFNLGKELKSMGLLVITDAMINRVMAMWKGGFLQRSLILQ